MIVEVRDKPPRSGRRDVSVDLDREVQLDLDGMGQRSDCAHVALDAVHDDRVATGEVVADAGKVEAAVSKAVGVRAFLVVPPHQAHCRWLCAEEVQQFLNRRLPPQQAVEVPGRVPLDVEVRAAQISSRKVSTSRGASTHPSDGLMVDLPKRLPKREW